MREQALPGSQESTPCSCCQGHVQGIHLDGLNLASAMVGIFAPQKSADYKSGLLLFFSWRTSGLTFIAHHCIYGTESKPRLAAYVTCFLSTQSSQISTTFPNTSALAWWLWAVKTPQLQKIQVSSRTEFLTTTFPAPPSTHMSLFSPLLVKLRLQNLFQIHARHMPSLAKKVIQFSSTPRSQVPHKVWSSHIFASPACPGSCQGSTSGLSFF